VIGLLSALVVCFVRVPVYAPELDDGS